MTKVLIATNMAKYNENISRNSILLPVIGNVLVAYNAMDIGKLTGAEFKAMVLSPEETVFDKMTGGEPVSIMGFAVDKTKAIEMIVKPNGYSDFIVARNTLKSKQSWEHYLNLTDVSDDGLQIVLSQSVLDTELEASKIYAEGANEILIYNFAKNILELAGETFGNKAGYYDFADMVNSIIHTHHDATGKKWYINPQGVKNYLVNKMPVVND